VRGAFTGWINGSYLLGELRKPCCDFLQVRQYQRKKKRGKLVDRSAVGGKDHNAVRRDP